MNLFSFPLVIYFCSMYKLDEISLYIQSINYLKQIAMVYRLKGGGGMVWVYFYSIQLYIFNI